MPIASLHSVWPLLTLELLPCHPASLNHSSAKKQVMTLPQAGLHSDYGCAKNLFGSRNCQRSPTTESDSPDRVSSEGSPIIRIWRGLTAERVAAAYFEHICSTGIPAYRSTKGNLGVYVLRRTENGVAEFIVISLWASLEAVGRFTSPADVNSAVYFYEDRLYLMFQEPRVAHYELAAAEDPLISHAETNPFDGTA